MSKPVIMECPICHGTGILRGGECALCLGEGQVLVCQVPDGMHTINNAVELIIDGKHVVGIPVKFRKGLN